MRISLASPPFPKSVADGLFWLDKLAGEAAGKGAGIICLPETYLPGYPLEEFAVEEAGDGELKQILSKACEIARANHIAIILPMNWYENGQFLNVAQVISETGKHLGYQTKNQLDPTEDHIWTAGTKRNFFEVNGLKFGLTICHEGFRYPESVRWAAQNGAHIVFHPHCAGSDEKGVKPAGWGDIASPYYEKAMMMRALENTIYFASSNYSFEYPESASSIIGPEGQLLAFQPYGEPGVVVADIDLDAATGYLAKRFKNELYSS